MATSMDRVYEFAATPRGETGTEGVVFRFVPDPRQVESALEVGPGEVCVCVCVWVV